MLLPTTAIDVDLLKPELTNLKSGKNCKENMSKTCSECAKTGEVSYLKLCQINFEEAIYLCQKKTCNFPLKHPQYESFIINRRSTCLVKQPRIETYDTPKIKSRRQEENSDALNAMGNLEDYLYQLPVTPPFSNNTEMDEAIDMPNFMSKFEINDNAEHDLDSFYNFQTIELNDMDHEAVNVKNTNKIESSKEAVFNNSGPADNLNISKNKTIRDPLLTKPLNYDKIMQWSNELNLCWLDVILMIIVNSVNMRDCFNISTDSYILYETCLKFDECQKKLKSGAAEITTLYSNMTQIRKTVFECLQSKINLKLGDLESPVEILPSVFKMSRDFNDLCSLHIRWEFQCEGCGHKRARRCKSNIISFPTTNLDFHPLNAQFQRACFKCNRENQVMSMYMEKLPPCLFFHFQTGLPHSKFQVWDFAIQNVLYSVFAVIQYQVKPFKHFVVWIRNTQTNKWIKFDDLSQKICTWQTKQPNVPPKEIYMVVWERQGNSNTEIANTNLLLRNEEVIDVGNNLPIDVYEAHKFDETIEISDDIIPSENQHVMLLNRNNSVNITNDSSNISAFNGDSFLMESQLKNSIGIDQALFGEEYKSFQNENDGIEEKESLRPHSSLSNSSSIVSQRSKQDMFSVIPSSNGQTTIQVIAPPNTCQVVILTNPQQNPVNNNSINFQNSMPLAHSVFTRSNEEIPVSFSDLGKHKLERLLRNTEHKPYKPRRQFKLQGYRKKLKNSNSEPLLEHWLTKKPDDYE